MNKNWAINEIDLLKEYFSERKSYKNICKALKDIVIAYSSFETSLSTTMYISNQIQYLYENTKGKDQDDALDLCKEHLKELYNQIENEEGKEIQAKVNNIIIQIMAILLLVKKNSEVIYNYALLLLENRPLTPITEDLNEWENVSSYFDTNYLVFQNKRASNVYMYKYNDEIEVKMIDAYYFSFNNGETWDLTEDSGLKLKLPTMVPRSEFIIK